MSAQSTATPAFSGSITALVTPFAGNDLDEDALRRLVDWQIGEGTSGLVPVGTTGESPTLSHDEHKRVVEIVIDEAKGRVPVIAGAGSNSTSEAIDFAIHAEKAGADAVLVVTPYYNKPTQAGMEAHFKAVAGAIGIPLIIYNIPPRSVIDMSVETMARLFEVKKHHRRQGCHRQHEPGEPPAADDGAGFPATVRRGCHGARLHGPWRARLHLGHGECRARAFARSSRPPASPAIMERRLRSRTG